MAINKKLIHFKTKSAFQTELDNSNLMDSSIVFIKETGEIWTHGKLYNSLSDAYEASALENSELQPEPGDTFETAVAKLHKAILDNEKTLSGAIVNINKSLGFNKEGKYASQKDILKGKTVTEALDFLSARVIDLEPLMDTYSYGVRWDTTVASPILTRVGNMSLHKSLPIQSKYRGCLAKGGKIVRYLNPANWNERLDGTDEDLSGQSGEVKIHTPKFYGKSFIDGNFREVRISETKLNDSWVEIPSLLIDAYRSTVLNTVPAGKRYLSELEQNSAISVVNTADYCRGGGNRADNDVYLDGDADHAKDIFKTDLGKPRTQAPRSTMRTWARNAGKELLTYEQYKWIFYWAWVIEYANFNSQAAFNSALTDEGFHQGGMGAGISNMANGSEYNGYYPLTPCGYGNTLGNETGVLDLVIPEFHWNTTSANVEDYQKQAAATSVNSANNGVTVSAVITAGVEAIGHDQNNIYGANTYVISGLTDGQTVVFKEVRSEVDEVVETVDSDGTYEITWSDKGVNGRRKVTFGQVQESCEIAIYASERATVDNVKTAQTFEMPRWRGFDNPFGDIWTNLDGIVIKRNAANQPSNVYATTDPACFDDNLENKEIVGVEIASDGYIKAFDLGEKAEIIPSAVGANDTTYMCDYHWCNAGSTDKRTLFVGSDADSGANDGLGFFASRYGVSFSHASVGFRSVSSFSSFEEEE